MQQTKHKSLPFSKTVMAKKVVGQKVLTKSGKNIGTVKSIHLHPTELTVEGILVDTGMFYVDQYFDENYIVSITEEGVVLKIDPVADLLGLDVFDATGKEIGKASAVNRSKLTNKLLSIVVETDNKKKTTITADYIATLGESIMLKEKFDITKFKENEEVCEVVENE